MIYIKNKVKNHKSSNPTYDPIRSYLQSCYNNNPTLIWIVFRNKDRRIIQSYNLDRNFNNGGLNETFWSNPGQQPPRHPPCAAAALPQCRRGTLNQFCNFSYFLEF